MKGYANIAVAIAAFAFAGCGGSNDRSNEARMNSRNEDIQAIRQLAADWRSGWLAGDVDALVSLYADEPVLMPQGQPVVTGKDAIRPLYDAVLKEVAIKSEGTLMEVEASGDWGVLLVHLQADGYAESWRSKDRK